MEEKKKNLKAIYDVINKIARVHREKGENVDEWFYTKAQIKELQKSNSKIFI